MRMKKFKTAQGFLESHYRREFHYYQHTQHTHERLTETREAKRQRSRQAERNAIRALLPAIGLNIKIDDGEEDLEQEIQRIQQLPEARGSAAQHFLKGAYQWLKRGRVIVLSSSSEATTIVGPPGVAQAK